MSTKETCKEGDLHENERGDDEMAIVEGIAVLVYSLVMVWLFLCALIRCIDEMKMRGCFEDEVCCDAQSGKV